MSPCTVCTVTTFSVCDKMVLVVQLWWSCRKQRIDQTWNQTSKEWSKEENSGIFEYRSWELALIIMFIFSNYEIKKFTFWCKKHHHTTLVGFSLCPSSFWIISRTFSVAMVYKIRLDIPLYLILSMTHHFAYLSRLLQCVFLFHLQKSRLKVYSYNLTVRSGQYPPRFSRMPGNPEWTSSGLKSPWAWRTCAEVAGFSLEQQILWDEC